MLYRFCDLTGYTYVISYSREKTGQLEHEMTVTHTGVSSLASGRVEGVCHVLFMDNFFYFLDLMI
jgi:hypothetical protein